MLKYIMTAGLFAAGFAFAIAQDPQPAQREQPKEAAKGKAVLGGGQPGGLGAQPGGFAQPANPFGTTRVTAATLARYEEEAEVLDAQLDVKKAYIKAAEVAVAGSKLKLDRVIKLEANKAISVEEVALAKFELETAVAQLEIRKAEAKEVEVRVKFAKKRVEDGKANIRVAPAARPAVDPKGRIDPIM
ncbi:MAG: hypothetical protein U0791_22210 [Gemmataceae bacterium]